MQTSQHPAYLMIENQLDLIAQKYRLLRVVRGAMLWVAMAAAVSLAATIALDLIGPGKLASMVLVVWIGLLIAMGVHWIVRPLVEKVRSVQIAQIVERRIDGLHNGLTNSVLLAQSPDLAESPFLAPIFDEVLASSRELPLESAVRLADLRPLAMRVLGVILLTAILAILIPARLAHGWQQMFAPTSFVPRVGQIQIIEVSPGDVSIVAGQPLEIGVVAKGPQSAETAPPARLVFDQLPKADLPGTFQAQDDTLRYAYHLDHVDASLKYRVEIGGTQSNWYSVNVVPKVTLQQLDVTITPPLYTRQPARTLSLQPTDLTAAVTAPMGSKIEIGATIDVAAKRALLMVNSNDPLDMTAAMQGKHFYREFTLMQDSVAFIGILAGDQIISKLPEQGLNIHCLADSPPTVQMTWPAEEISIPPTIDLTIQAIVRDDYGVQSARLLSGVGDAEPTLVAGSEKALIGAPTVVAVSFPIKLDAGQAVDGASVTVQVEATDNRDLTDLSKELGPQIARSEKVVIHFQDPAKTAAAQAQEVQQLADLLQDLIRRQQALQTQTSVLLPTGSAKKLTTAIDRNAMAGISAGQVDLRQRMQRIAQTFGFNDRTRIVQKTLMVLALNPATDAVEISQLILAEPSASQQIRQTTTLTLRQQTILDALNALLAGLIPADQLNQSNARLSPSMPNPEDAFKKLDDALKQYMEEQRRIISQTAPLAKKPVDDYDDQDKKNLDALKIAQDKLDAFMEEQLADFSKNAEQDLSNPSLLKDMTSIYSETTMAADALNKKSAETAVPAEENGLESAQELQTNIEKWLANTPDRTQWTQEDPLKQNDAPMPELPKELDDMVGKLLEQQEDLDQQMEDANANWQDSLDKGIGWDAMDGPIADMSAKGVTGNTLPNNNEMQGRSGQGRNGKSDGEFVGDSMTDKGGRNTPTRLDPTPFEKGQVNNQSHEPPGGATGGGKTAGAGAEGLEGPVPPDVQHEMQRLAQMQAQIRNEAEHLNLQYRVGRYDNFKLLQGIVLMRHVEQDLAANRYQNALRQTDAAEDDLETSSILVGGRIHVEQDTTPETGRKIRKEIDDAEQGDLPPAWSQSLRQYYQKLAEQ
jgi:Domain of unknown function (DUF4175)